MNDKSRCDTIRDKEKRINPILNSRVEYNVSYEHKSNRKVTLILNLKTVVKKCNTCKKYSYI